MLRKRIFLFSIQRDYHIIWMNTHRKATNDPLPFTKSNRKGKVPIIDAGCLKSSHSSKHFQQWRPQLGFCWHCFFFRAPRGWLVSIGQGGATKSCDDGIGSRVSFPQVLPPIRGDDCVCEVVEKFPSPPLNRGAANEVLITKKVPSDNAAKSHRSNRFLGEKYLSPLEVIPWFISISILL